MLKVLSSFTFDQNRPSKCFREQASKLQFEFESSVHGDEDGKLELARKAYLSYVRMYATYSRSMRNFVSFKELHLGHICKSFALRDAPRTLSSFKQEFASKKMIHRSPTEKFSSKFASKSNIFNKRQIPIESKFSEFDSGV